MSNERQKPTTDKYRENYDRIFRKGHWYVPGDPEATARNYDRAKAKAEQARENNEALDKILGCDC